MTGLNGDLVPYYPGEIRAIPPETRPVILQCAIDYRAEHGLSMDPKEFNPITQIIEDAFVIGSFDQPERKKWGKPDTKRAIEAGLYQRNEFIKEARRVRDDLEIVGISGAYLWEDLALPSEARNAFREQLKPRNVYLTPDLSLSREVMFLESEEGRRKNAIFKAATSALSKFEGILPQSDDIQAQLEGNIDLQSTIIRGYATTFLLLVNGVRGDFNPTLITPEAVESLMEISWNQGRDEEYLRALSRQMFMYLNIGNEDGINVEDESGDSNDMIIFDGDEAAHTATDRLGENDADEVSEVLFQYLKQTTEKARLLSKSRSYKEFRGSDPSSHDHMFKETDFAVAIRDTLTGLPHDQSFLGTNFVFDPEQARKIEDKVTPHLWKYGVTMDGVKIPSIMDLTIALRFLNNRDSGEDFSLKSKIRKAMKFWQDYQRIAGDYPDLIKADLQKASEIRTQIDGPIPARSVYTTYGISLASAQIVLKNIETLVGLNAKIGEAITMKGTLDPIYLSHFESRKSFLENQIKRLNRRMNELRDERGQRRWIDFEDALTIGLPRSLEEDLNRYERDIEELQAEPQRAIPARLERFLERNGIAAQSFIKALNTSKRSSEQKKLDVIAATILADSRNIDPWFMRSDYMHEANKRIEMLRETIVTERELDETNAELEETNNILTTAREQGFHIDEQDAEKMLKELKIRHLPLIFQERIMSYAHRTQMDRMSPVEGLLVIRQSRITPTLSEYIIPPRKHLETFLQSVVDDLSVSGKRSGVRIMFNKLIANLDNPLIPWDLGEGMNFRVFLGALSTRTSIAKSIIDLEQQKAKIAQLKRNRRLSEQAKRNYNLNDSAARAEANARYRQNILNNVDSMLATKLSELGFGIPVEE